MNTTIKTGFAAICVLIALSCKKERSDLQSTAENDALDIGTGKYPSVFIVNQTWMEKNLDVGYYRNGDKIPQVKDPVKWGTLTTGAWCWYNNDSVFGAVYGKLYNWYAVNDPRGLAPIGWHVATDAEWDTLLTHLKHNPGGKLKDTGTIEAGTGLWYAPNKKAINTSGFTALPGGRRWYDDGVFYELGYRGYWWTSTEYALYNSWCRLMDYDGAWIYRTFNVKSDGFSVRCVKD